MLYSTIFEKRREKESFIRFMWKQTNIAEQDDDLLIHIQRKWIRRSKEKWKESHVLRDDESAFSTE